MGDPVPVESDVRGAAGDGSGARRIPSGLCFSIMRRGQGIKPGRPPQRFL